MLTIIRNILIVLTGCSGLFFGVAGIVKPVKISKSFFLTKKGALIRGNYLTIATILINTAFALYYPTIVWLVITVIIIIPIWIEYLINVVRAKSFESNFDDSKNE